MILGRIRMILGLIRIRMILGLIRIHNLCAHPDPSINKHKNDEKMKKILDLYCFVTSLLRRSWYP
jgi:hypothetical protein